MLPRSTNTRMNRESRGPSGRSQEIQRLVGRSAARRDRSAPSSASARSWVDCDVIQADGGTRTAAITGGFVALADAIARLVRGWRPAARLRDCVAAISVGIVGGEPVLDLDYVEDSTAEVDMNVVMTGGGRVRRGAGHRRAGRRSAARGSTTLLALAERGIRQPRRPCSGARSTPCRARLQVNGAQKSPISPRCAAGGQGAPRSGAVKKRLRRHAQPRKLRELRAARRVPDELLLLADVPGAASRGDRQDYAENALIKARAAALATGVIALADDRARGRRPRGRDRASTPRASAARGSTTPAATRTLLERARAACRRRRTARYRCVHRARRAERPRARGARATVRRAHPDAPRGAGGFGYDPCSSIRRSARRIGRAHARREERRRVEPSR